MPTDVDSLINELFPEKGSSQLSSQPAKIPSDWDSPPKGVVSGSSHQHQPRGNGGAAADGAVPASTNIPERKKGEPRSDKPRSNFDDDSDDEITSGNAGRVTPSSAGAPATYATTGPTSALAGHTVPFPPVLDGLCAACPHSCAVTAQGNPALYHPSVSELRVLHTHLDTSTPRSVIMRRKGAMHACFPTDASIGNGAGEGGCVHITCRRCDHLVVRLQNASWDDQDGQLDLYLALRNYYPDWSRLASLTTADANRAPLLVPAENAAAYCCQCSWLTAHEPRPTVIATMSMDLVAFNRMVEKDHAKMHCAFATHVPLADGETRRPPLWECRGHNAF